MAKKKDTTPKQVGERGDAATTSKNIADTLKMIQTKFGEGSIMKMGDSPKVNIDVIPTGSLGLDAALGIGGVPRGRIIEIYGPESSGKTTLSLHIVAEAQKKGGVCAFIDAEHAMDPEYAGKLGVKIEELLISQPDTGEQGLEIAESLVRSGSIDVIVIDSVAALTPKDEIEGDMGAHHVGKQARLMSQALRKLTALVARTKTVIIFINQIRMQIGVMFGNPETTTGGRSLKFYASVRLEIRRIQTITDKGQSLGNRTKVKVVKNKVAPPFKEAEFDLIFGEGISQEGSILDAAIDTGVIEPSGAWFKYKGENIAQGRENAKTYLKENAKVASEIEKEVYEKLELRNTKKLESKIDKAK